jgi:hypothetical protein
MHEILFIADLYLVSTEKLIRSRLRVAVPSKYGEQISFDAALCKLSIVILGPIYFMPSSRKETKYKELLHINDTEPKVVRRFLSQNIYIHE